MPSFAFTAPGFRNFKRCATWSISALVLVIGVFLCVSVVGDAIAEHRAVEQRRSDLLAARSKSVAHNFVVSHWFQCNGLVQTRASCYAAIRSVAATGGDAFVRQVDDAARELKLL